MSKLTEIKSLFLEDEGEATVMFLGDEVIGGWYGNDADWRHEYFAPMMERLGYVVNSIDKPTKAQRKAALKFLGQ